MTRLTPTKDYEQSAKDYEQSAKVYGEATLGKRTVALTDNAVADNYGTNPTRICYYASAIDRRGNIYCVRWDTTDDWDMACELAYLEAQDDLTAEDEERMAELREESLPDCGDESNACEWDNPADISVR